MPSGGARIGAGRPSKLTPQLSAKLCHYLERGHTIEGATGMVGIHRDTYYGWIEHGHAARVLRAQGRPVPRAELPYLAFTDAAELARNYGEGWLFEQMLEAAEGGAKDKHLKRWQAYMTALERTRSDRWRRRAAAEFVAQKDAAPAMFTFDPEKLSTDELAELGVLLAKAAPTAED
jgi:hypothetical protein